MRTMIFAHRGIPVKFPENSLAGFRYCIEHHADALEFDVHLTKDNVPVVMHDEKINRTTDGKGYIKDYSLDELKKFHLLNGETIPTLDQFFMLVGNHDIHLNLEFKTNKIHYPGIEKIVLKKVSDLNLRYPVIYSSFNINSIRIAKRLDNSQNYNYLFQRHILHPDRVIIHEGLNSIHPGYYIKGLERHERIWTVDDPIKQTELIEKGVQGIFTNNFEQGQRIRDDYQN